MEENRKTVAIVGASPAGIIKAKEYIESGLIPSIFEMGNDFGGLWRNDRGIGPKMKANISKYCFQFTDLPWSDSSDWSHQKKLV
jgi:cation diffusion facilitator CzcD-associated flavoprotein CzcO